jgi:hypothetical protein
MNAQQPTTDDERAAAFAAELTAAVYQVALRHGTAERWLDLELDLWSAIAGVMDRWLPEITGAQAQRYLWFDHS